MSDSYAPTRERPSAAGEHAEWSAADSTEVIRRPVAVHDRDDLRAEYGGLRMAAVFFGWLVAVGLPALLVAVTGTVAALAGTSLDVSRSDAREQAQAIGIAGGLLLILFMLLGYFAGGYVAGRMTRFDPMRQGVAVWAFGLLAGILVAVAGAAVTTGYSLNERLNLSTVSMPAGAFDARGIFAFAFLLLATLLAAVVGARAGQRYHAKIDA